MKRFVVIAGVILVGCTSAQAQQSTASEPAKPKEMDAAALLDELYPDRERPKVDLAKLDAHPLGSKQNPVRVSGPAGEQAYLTRLRCRDGNMPQLRRLGIAEEASPFGYIMDVYAVSCNGESPSEVFMDMYHAKHKETRAVAGFSIEPAT